MGRCSYKTVFWCACSLLACGPEGPILSTDSGDSTEASGNDDTGDTDDSDSNTSSSDGPGDDSSTGDGAPMSECPLTDAAARLVQETVLDTVDELRWAARDVPAGSRVPFTMAFVGEPLQANASWLLERRCTEATTHDEPVCEPLRWSEALACRRYRCVAADLVYAETEITPHDSESGLTYPTDGGTVAYRRSPRREWVIGYGARVGTLRSMSHDEVAVELEDEIVELSHVDVMEVTVESTGELGNGTLLVVFPDVTGDGRQIDVEARFSDGVLGGRIEHGGRAVGTVRADGTLDWALSCG